MVAALLGLCAACSSSHASAGPDAHAFARFMRADEATLRQRPQPSPDETARDFRIMADWCKKDPVSTEARHVVAALPQSGRHDTYRYFGYLDFACGRTFVERVIAAAHGITEKQRADLRATFAEVDTRYRPH